MTHLDNTVAAEEKGASKQLMAIGSDGNIVYVQRAPRVPHNGNQASLKHDGDRQDGKNLLELLSNKVPKLKKLKYYEQGTEETADLAVRSAEPTPGSTAVGSPEGTPSSPRIPANDGKEWDKYLVASYPLKGKGRDYDPEKNFFRRLRTSFGKVCGSLIARLKSVDGIDEVANGIAQVRGYTGPIAAEAVFAVGFPFVVFGFIGMLGESKEAREALKDLAENKNASLDDLKKIAQENGAAEGEEALNIDLSTREGRENVKDAQAILKRIHEKYKATDEEKKRETCLEYLRCYCGLKGRELREPETRLDAAAAPFGNVALGGMTAAMIPGAGWGAARIAVEALGSEKIETAKAVSGASAAGASASILGFITTGIFAVANAAMAVYAGLRCIAGRKRDKRLKEEGESLQAIATENPSLVSGDAAKIHAQCNAAERATNKWSSTLYGAGTAVSQAALAANGAVGVAAFAGSAAAAGAAASCGIGLAVAGAGGAVAAAGKRIREDIKAEKRRGDEDRVPDEWKLEATEEIEPEKQLAEYSAKAEKQEAELTVYKALSLSERASRKAGSDDEEYTKTMKKWLSAGGKRGVLWGKGTSAVEFSRNKLQKECKWAISPTGEIEGASFVEKTLKEQKVTPQNILDGLQESGDLEQFSRQFAIEIMNEDGMPKNVLDAKNELRAQDKLLSLAFKAFDGNKNPQQRIRAMERAVKAAYEGKHTHLSCGDRAALQKLFNNKKAQLEEALNCKSNTAFCNRLKEEGLPATRILSFADRHNMSTDIEREEFVRDAEKPAGPFGLLSYSATKNNYNLCLGSLYALCGKEKGTDEEENRRLSWLKSKVYNAGARLFIDAKKNAAKVNMYDAVTQMNRAALYYNEDKNQRQSGGVAAAA